jgi:hypothetical protein
MDSGIRSPTLRPSQLEDPAAADRSALTWERVAQRVERYLGAMGVTEPLHRARLTARIRQRWEARVNAAPLEDPVETAIEETCALLDAWLCSEMDIEGDRAALFAARAAVLSGAVPNWAARFAGVGGDSIAAQIRGASVQAIPEPAPLTMEPTTIDLCCHRLARRIVAAFRVLIGSVPVPDSTGRKAADATPAGQPQ